MPPCMVMSFVTCNSAEAYLSEMGQIIDDTKRKSAHVMCLLKMSDTEVMNIEIADSNAMLADCVKVADHPLAATCVNAMTKAKVFTVGCEDRLKEFYDKLASDMFEVKHVDGAPGYFAPACKGTALYYIRVMKHTLKPEASMAEWLKFTGEVMPPFAKDIGILTEQCIPFDDKTTYTIEVSTPKLWIESFKKMKSDKAFASKMQGASSMLAGTDNFYYGKTSDMMNTVSSAVVRQSMLVMPGAAAAAAPPKTTAKMLSREEACGWF